MPVSYTHLDVYKRQVCGTLPEVQPSTRLPSAARISSFAPGSSLPLVMSRLEISTVVRRFVSVSYTNLDVYKRQVQFLVALHLLRGKVSKIVAGQPADEKRAMNDVIVAQHTVQRQVFCNAVIVADDTGAIPPRVHGLDGAADHCLLDVYKRQVAQTGNLPHKFRMVCAVARMDFFAQD